MRADARANRERILVAAEEVFGAKGAQASTEEVAARAGVGIATVFRHFPTKVDLLEATLVRHFAELSARAEALAVTPDAGRALRDLVTDMVRSGITKVTLVTLLTATDPFPPAAAEAADRLRATVERVLARAQEAGAARPDARVDEVYVLIGGLTRAAAVRPVSPATLDGALRIVLAGLAAGAEHLA